MTFQTDFSIDIVRAIMVFTRITVFLFAGPVFNLPQFKDRWRTMLALAITIIIFPVLPNTWAGMPREQLNVLGLALLVIGELVFGLTIALIVRLYMEIVVIGGFLIDRGLGFAMAQMFDPGADGQRTIVSLVFVQIFTVLFLVFDGHHDFVRLCVASFSTIGPGAFNINQAIFDNVLGISSNMFAEGFRISLPIFVTIMTINVAMAFMTKFAQDFQVMMLSFPIRLGLGLFVLLSMLPVFATICRDLIGEMLESISHILAG